MNGIKGFFFFLLFLVFSRFQILYNAISYNNTFLFTQMTYTIHLSSCQHAIFIILRQVKSFTWAFFQLQEDRLQCTGGGGWSVKFQVLSVPYESKLLHVRNFPSILCLKHEIVHLYSCPLAKLFKRSYIKNKKLLQSVNLPLQNSVNIEMLELIFKKRS